MNRLCLALAAATVVSGVATTSRPAVAAPTSEATHRTSTRSVTLAAPKDVTEGDRYMVAAKVTAARKATTIQWQALLPEYYGDSTPVWTAVRNAKVNGIAEHTYKAVADASQSQQYRAVVTYADGQHVTSHRVTVHLWHWVDLTSYTSYYKVGTVFDSPYISFAMNGDTWEGWYVHNGMGESRYTLGRNCTAFRGTLGVGDFTDDGGTAQITLLTDETNVVYTSPTLVPGLVVPVQLDLDEPYRFSIQGRDTTPDDGIARDVYPAIGAPQFLCHVS